MRYSTLAWHVESPEFKPHQPTPSQRKLCGTTIYGDNYPGNEFKMRSRNISVVSGHSFYMVAASYRPHEGPTANIVGFPSTCFPVQECGWNFGMWLMLFSHYSMIPLRSLMEGSPCSALTERTFVPTLPDSAESVSIQSRHQGMLWDSPIYYPSRISVC